MPDTLIQDVRYALRGLRRDPSFTAVAVLTLALGIGANAGIFSVARAVLLRPLPFHDADALVVVWGNDPRGTWQKLPLSFPNYSDIARRATSLSAVGAWSSSPDTRMTLTGAGAPTELQAALASGDLFGTLGAEAEVGRLLVAGDDDPSAPAAAVLAYDFWRRRFGGDPDVVGRTLALDGRTFVVVGVLRESFRFAGYPRPADVWLPLGHDPFGGAGPRSRQYARGVKYLGVVGRLAPGVTAAAAGAELAHIGEAMAAEDPYFNAGFAPFLSPVVDEVRGPVRTTVLVLGAAVGLVLLVACANMTNLLFASASARIREVTVRAALGASRWRLLRQLLTESLVLAAIGGVAGVLFAAWAMRIFAWVTVREVDPFLVAGFPAGDVAIDGTVLGFVAALALTTGLLFGVPPALDAVRSSSAPGSPVQRGAASHRPLALRSALVAVQVAVSIVLATGALVLVTGLLALERRPVGFTSEGAVVVEMHLARDRYAAGDRAAAFYEQLLARLAETPGVTAAGAVQTLPMMGEPASTDFRIEGQPEPEPGQTPVTRFEAVTPGAFDALGVRVVRGRAFTASDRADAPRVTVVSERFARRFWPGEDPIGRRLALSTEALRFVADAPPIVDFASAWREVVGVVADVRRSPSEDAYVPEVHIPLAQSPRRDMTIVVRGEAVGSGRGLTPAAVEARLRGVVAELDAQQPVGAARRFEGIVAAQLDRPRSRTVLLGLFAALAVALAAVGIYGVVAYGVARRRSEIAVRLALGGSPAALVRMFVLSGLRVVAAGIVPGVLLSLIGVRVLRALIAETAPPPAAAYLAVAAGAALIAAVAVLLPARRAARVAPGLLLRAE